MPAPHNSNAQPGSTERGATENAFDRAQIDARQHPDEPAGLPLADPNEPPSLAVAPVTPEPAPELEPRQLEPVADPRAEIYKRFRSQERPAETEGDDPFAALADAMTPPFMREAETPAADPDPAPVPTPAAEPAPPEPAAAPPITLKINHQLYAVTYDQAVEMAGFKPDEAKSLSVDTIVRFAQINEANRLRDTRRADPQPSASPQAPEPDTTAPSDPAAPSEADYDLDKIVVQGNDPEGKAEFEKAVSQVLDKRLAAKSEAEKFQDAQTETAQALTDFVQRAPELARDEALQHVVVATATDLMIEDLIKVGAPKGMVMQLRGTPKDVTQLYIAAMAKGAKLTPPGKILESAEQQVRTRFAPIIAATARAEPAPSPQPAPAPAPSAALQQRQQAKQALPQVPSRSGAERGQPARVDEMSSRSRAVDKMRQMRGQMPLR